MSDDEISPPSKRSKLESTSDLEISPILTDSSQDKSGDVQSLENERTSSSFNSFHDTKVF